MSSAPFAIAKLTKEGEFMKTHRDLTVTISMAAFKRKAVVHRLFDIWYGNNAHTQARTPRDPRDT